MAQNLNDLDTAALRVVLALLRAQNLVEQIRVEEERAGQVIHVNWHGAGHLRGLNWPSASCRPIRRTHTSASSSEDKIHMGIEGKLETYVQAELSWKVGDLWPGFEIKAGVKASLERVAGYQHAWTWTGSTKRYGTDCGSDRRLREHPSPQGGRGPGCYRGCQQRRSRPQPAAPAVGSPEEHDIAMAEFNKLAAEHNYLVERRSRLLNMRDQAINRRGQP